MASSVTVSIAGSVIDTVKVLPMTDHYAVMANDEIVAVVCRTNDDQWRVEVLTGYVDGVSSYIPLHCALKTAMTWRRYR